MNVKDVRESGQLLLIAILGQLHWVSLQPALDQGSELVFDNLRELRLVRFELSFKLLLLVLELILFFT